MLVTTVKSLNCSNYKVKVNMNRGSSGGLAGMIWAGPLFEFSTLLNHYKTTYLPKSLNSISLIQITISFYCSLISRDDIEIRIVESSASSPVATLL